MGCNKRKVESPSVRNCCLDLDDICIGCFRALSEIKEWALVGEQGRQEFLENSLKRKLEKQGPTSDFSQSRWK